MDQKFSNKVLLYFLTLHVTGVNLHWSSLKPNSGTFFSENFYTLEETYWSSSMLRSGVHHSRKNDNSTYIKGNEINFKIYIKM